MCEVLRETIPEVSASDVFDYGRGYEVADFLDARLPMPPVDLLCANPPFNAALAFAMRGLTLAHVVALLLRTVWIEGESRYRGLLRDRPPTLMAQFSERVAMRRGVWDPNGSTATAYAWFVWVRDAAPMPLLLIPPGCKAGMTLHTDYARFAPLREAPLLSLLD